MIGASESRRDFRRPAFLAAASTFIVLSSIVIYVVIEAQPSGAPEQTGLANQSAPVFPPWFEYSLVGAWSISLLALIVLYFRSKKPRSNIPYPERTRSPA